LISKSGHHIFFAKRALTPISSNLKCDGDVRQDAAEPGVSKLEPGTTVSSEKEQNFGMSISNLQKIKGT